MGSKRRFERVHARRRTAGRGESVAAAERKKRIKFFQTETGRTPGKRKAKEDQRGRGTWRAGNVRKEQRKGPL